MNELQAILDAKPPLSLPETAIIFSKMAHLHTKNKAYVLGKNAAILGLRADTSCFNGWFVLYFCLDKLCSMKKLEVLAQAARCASTEYNKKLVMQRIQRLKLTSKVQQQLTCCIGVPLSKEFGLCLLEESDAGYLMPESFIFYLHYVHDDNDRHKLGKMQQQCEVPTEALAWWKSIEKDVLSTKCFPRWEPSAEFAFDVMLLNVINKSCAKHESVLSGEITLINTVMHNVYKTQRFDPIINDESKTKGVVGMGCLAVVSLLGYLVNTKNSLLTVAVLRAEFTRAKKNPLKAFQITDGRTVFESLQQHRNSTTPVFYALYSTYCDAKSAHAVAMIQTPGPHALYRVIQAYGFTYSLSDWLNTKVDSSFNQWMPYDQACQFWARALAAAMSGQDWLRDTSFELAFGTPFRGQAHKYCLEFMVEGFNEVQFQQRLVELQAK